MKTYNSKRFLLLYSPNSCAMFHARVNESGDYKLVIHDCNTGIRLHGNLNTEEGREEALEKLTALACGVGELRNFINENY